MNIKANLHNNPQQPKTITKVVDLSRVVLREIFETNEDFTNGVIKDITPAIAEKMLQYNTANRVIRQSHVDWLSSQMLAGYWRFTGDSIKFNLDGIIVDKQHTLNAIIKSGTTQKFLVIGGLDDTIIDVIDTGIARTAGDVLKMNGISNANNLAAICRRVLLFKHKQKVGSFSKTTPGSKQVIEKNTDRLFISNLRILEEIQTDTRYLDACINASKFYESSRILSLSQYGMLYFLFAEKDPDSAWEFLSKFSNGIGLTENSPIYQLRKRMEKERDNKVKYADSLKMYWFFTCWNKFRKKETIIVLQTPNKVEIPELL